MKDKIIIGAAASAFALSIIYVKNRVFLDRFRKEAELANTPANLTETPSTTIGVQVDGKSCAEVSVATDASQEDAKVAALSHPKVEERTQGRLLKKIVYVKGRIINLITSSD